MPDIKVTEQPNYQVLSDMAQYNFPTKLCQDAACLKTSRVSKSFISEQHLTTTKQSKEDLEDWISINN